MMSIYMKEAYDVASKYDAKLKATDPRFNGIVIVNGVSDNSHFVYSEAFVLKFKDFYCVFTEHYNVQVFHKEDYNVISYTNRIVIKPLKI